MISINPWVRPPWVLRKYYPEALWRIDNSEKKIYLTFDDGPIPEVTPWLIEVLATFSAEATFFCVGENVEKYPFIYEQIISHGHSVGNHTFNHLHGLKTSRNEYLQNVEKAANLIHSGLFRPPKGLMSPSQYESVKKHYRIIMWDLLSYDFDSGRSAHKVLKIVLDYVRPGSIITFHDSVRSYGNLKEIFPGLLKILTEKGYSFHNIEQEPIKALSSHH